MPFVAAGLMVGSGVIGVVLMVRGLWLLARTIQRRPHLMRADGRVSAIQRRQERVSSGRFTKLVSVYHPVIRFHHAQGHAATFTAARLATSRAAQYRVGQKLPVIYDPANTLPPLVNRGMAIWSPPLELLGVGGTLIGASWMIWFAFGERIVAFVSG